MRATCRLFLSCGARAAVFFWMFRVEFRYVNTRTDRNGTMVIKTVSCSMLEVEKIVFACSECGASLELPQPPPSREAA